MVPVRERAEVAVGGEVGAQPALLRRTPCAADDRAVAVQDDDVPRAEGVRVPPCQRSPEGRPPVREVAGAVVTVVVVADRGHRAALETRPGIAAVVAAVVEDVSKGCDRSGQPVEELRSRLVPRRRTRADVAGGQKRRRGGRRHREGERGEDGSQHWAKVPPTCQAKLRGTAPQHQADGRRHRARRLPNGDCGTEHD